MHAIPNRHKGDGKHKNCKQNTIRYQKISASAFGLCHGRLIAD